MSTRTIHKQIVSDSSSFISLPAIELITTIPTSQESNKIPISLIVSLGGDNFIDGNVSTLLENEGNIKRIDTQLGTLVSYYYALPRRTSRNKSDTSIQRDPEVIGMPLLDTSYDTVADITRQLAILIVKKYHRPCYVAWSLKNGSDLSSLELNQLFIVKKCMEILVPLLKE
ncbi:Poc4p NDAI_0E01270 [Naumovozyma dairenensis CBS 421]|uniref:Proteasome assembly chaperone 4 n=1 Tax=Naumovozyma dairenensis (strain ATCC 10597 / BCRC 20456 / CBS 421 / NBRC 0211 / NRRL Y-12639) TaxID=1071378 RepID=G0WB23_NAUDC|nr:hypothetical protein NDAI_0E01270 [Naumovozyma dairenensis CBS 421]CCD24943.1 hypothetical protein NDAI_0E01270 [Naumovozyma dairenensis CBS 421]